VFLTDCNNQKVSVLSKDGTEAKYFLDRTQGIERPKGRAVDGTGRLWIGCYDGKIHIDY